MSFSREKPLARRVDHGGCHGQRSGSDDQTDLHLDGHQRNIRQSDQREDRLYGSLAGTNQQLCLNLVNCIRAQHCAPNGDAQPCYCGTASDIGCLSGQANGKCKAEVEAAAKSPDPGAIANEFVDSTFPLGLATNLVGCDHDSCSTQCPL